MNFLRKKKPEVYRSPEEVRREAIYTKFKKWFPELTDVQIAKFHQYIDELVKFSKTMSLVSSVSLNRAESIHFADSIFASKIIIPKLIPGKELFDVGVGNGFPSLVMSVLYPDLPITILERDSRRVEFLKYMISALETKNVKLITKSIEEQAEKSLHNVVTRGYAPLHKTMITARKFVPKGGQIFHMKGDSFSTELAMVPTQVFSYWAPSVLGSYVLPDTNTAECVILTEKIAD